MQVMLPLLFLDLILQFIAIPIATLILFGCSKLFKLKDSSVKTALKVALLLFVAVVILDLVNFSILMVSGDFLVYGLISLFIMLIYYVLAFALILTFYKEDLMKTFLVWLLFSVIEFVFAIVLGVLIGLLVGALGYASFTSMY